MCTSKLLKTIFFYYVLLFQFLKECVSTKDKNIAIYQQYIPDISCIERPQYDIS